MIIKQEFVVNEIKLVFQLMINSVCFGSVK
jgi:hypothetical protein